MLLAAQLVFCLKTRFAAFSTQFIMTFSTAFVFSSCIPAKTCASVNRSVRGIAPSAWSSISQRVPELSIPMQFSQNRVSRVLLMASSPPENPDPPSGQDEISKSTARQVVVIGAWLAAVVHNIMFLKTIPGGLTAEDPVSMEFFKNLMDPLAVNPIFWGVFQMLGVWPVIYMCVLHYKRFNNPTWFNASAVASLFMGMYAFSPYIGLRKDQLPADENQKSWLDSLLENKIPVGLALGFTLFCFFRMSGFIEFPNELIDVVLFSRLVNYKVMFDQSPLVHLSTVDFFLFWFLFPVVMSEDMKMRKLWGTDQVSNWLTIITTQSAPVIGPLVYLLTRPKVGGSSKRD